MELEVFLARSTGSVLGGFSLPLFPTIQVARHFSKTEIATKAPVSDVLLVSPTIGAGDDSKAAVQLTLITQRNRVGFSFPSFSRHN